MYNKNTFNKLEKLHLVKNIAVPSEVHGYSLGVEFMRDWFLDKFPQDYFKTVYVNGKHVMDDFRRFNKEKILTVERPALAIIPSINTEYNRDTVDLELGGRDVLVRRSPIYHDAFIQDFDNNIFLGIVLKQLEMPFNFKIRVSTRAQQLDLANYMKMSHRIGATQFKYLSLDFHIPYEIILNIAKDNNFVIENNKVKDNIGFLKYLNEHSFLPIMFKFRTINGKSEYFVRVDNAYTHISCLEPLQLDDGDRNGQLSTNFHIEMNSILKIIVPNYYFYYSKESVPIGPQQITSLESLYTYKTVEPPEKNYKGWDQYLSTEYDEPNMYIDNIDFNELIEGGQLAKVINYTKSIGVSPSVFIDIQVYCAREFVETEINWDTMQIQVNQKMDEELSKITIYIDKGYFNEQLVVINNALSGRVQ